MVDELVLFNVQHEEQGVVTQKICNILIFTRAKRLGETCICYFTRKGIHLQVFYGGKQIGKQRTLQRTLKHVLSLLKKIRSAEASPFNMKDWTEGVSKRRIVITGTSISRWNSFVKRTKFSLIKWHNWIRWTKIKVSSAKQQYTLQMISLLLMTF